MESILILPGWFRWITGRFSAFASKAVTPCVFATISSEVAEMSMAVMERRPAIRADEHDTYRAPSRTPLEQARLPKPIPGRSRRPRAPYAACFPRGIVMMIPPITSSCLKSRLGLLACALWQPMQAWDTARSA